MTTEITAPVKDIVSWEDLDALTADLAVQLEGRHFDVLLAIARGGLVPAAIVARELDIHLVDTICISSYDWKDKKGEADVLKGFAGDGAGWLLIDDLVDTGRTARIVREMVPKAHFATIYAKPAGREQVDTFITEVSQDTWILFPWDAESQFVQPLAAGR